MSTILVVDDRVTNRDYLVTLLGYSGHRMLAAASGEEGLVLARAEAPDLIIADIVMPTMDGYDFARLVRAEPNLNQTRIVFYTASYALAETRRLAEACGVTHIIGKPAEPEELLRTINLALASTQLPTVPPATEAFHQEHMRLLTDKLAEKVEELEAEIAERRRAEAQIQRQLQRLSALRTIDVTISASLDLRVTLPVVLDQVITQLQVDAADIFLLRAQTNTLEYVTGRGLRSEVAPDQRVRLGQPYAGRVALERRHVSLPDLAQEAADETRVASFAAEGIRAYFGVPLISKGQVTGVLEVFQRTPLYPERDWLDFLEALAGQAAIAIDNARLFDDLQRSNQELNLAYAETIEGWSRALDLRDKETEGHSQRVTEITLRLGRVMGVSDEELEHMRWGALLHDIGKMAMPDSILLKPGPLTEEETAIMRQHPAKAFAMLSPIRHLRQALDIPYCHHEKWDGTGYPRQLRGTVIPLAARIFTVVDVWDALCSDRPYRAAWPAGEVRAYLRAQAGQRFDPVAVEAFMTLGFADQP